MVRMDRIAGAFGRMPASVACGAGGFGRRRGYAFRRFLRTGAGVYAARRSPRNRCDTTMRTVVSLDTCRDLAARALLNAGASPAHAEATADHITRAEADRCPSHGLFRLPGYVAAIRSGGIDPVAEPQVEDLAPGMVSVDGRCGMAPLSVARGRPILARKTRETGIACMGLRNSFNFAALWPDIEPLAEQGLVAFTFVNSRSFVAPAGGTGALFGTNPMAFACPRAGGLPPMVFDQASSVMANGEIRLAARDGHRVPEGVGLGPDGRPTTDPNGILEGVQLAFGGHKGSSIALMVEIMAAGLSDGLFSHESTADYRNDGGPSNAAQSFIALDPERMAGPAFRDRVEGMFGRVLSNGSARLPGDRRLAARSETRTAGIEVPDTLLAAVEGLAAG